MNPRRFLKQLFTAKEESDTDYDGPFSYPREFHATAIGAGAGVAAATTGDTQLISAVATVALSGDRVRRARKLTDKASHEVKGEGWYALFGIALGFAAATVLL